MPHKQPERQIERRTLATEFRISDAGQAPSIIGYGAVFESPASNGLWTEVIDSHAFDNVMGANPDVRALFNHDPNLVLGRTTAGTLKLNIDARGLAYEIDPPDTQVARDLIVSMRRKDVTGSSFGFIVARDQWTENQDGTVSRRILEIEELLDVSPVTYPFYGGAGSSLRSLPASMPKEIRSKVVSKRSDDDGSDDLDGPQNTDGCECDCPQCEAGHCNLCSNDDCTDPVCACYNQRSMVTASERRRMEMQLAFATLYS